MKDAKGSIPLSPSKELFISWLRSGPEGVARFNQWRELHHREDVNLTLANLEGADLSGANLGGVRLYQANLRGAVLRDAFLFQANLNSAILVGADLSNADLNGAGLMSAKMMGATLSGADLEGAQLTYANLTRCKSMQEVKIGVDGKGNSTNFSRVIIDEPTLRNEKIIPAYVRQEIEKAREAAKRAIVNQPADALPPPGRPGRPPNGENGRG